MIETYKNRYALLAINEKYIFWNVLLFGLTALFGGINFLFTDSESSFFVEFFWLNSSFTELLYKPWTLFTYGFLHYNFFWHLLGNMIGLYFFGHIFITFYNKRQFQNFYWVSAIAAGLFFMIAYAVFPTLQNKPAVLVGSSGAVFSILFAATAKSPTYIFNLFGVLRIPLWVLSALYTIMFISSIPVAPGGQFAHLGGALFGYVASKQLDKGVNLCRWFEVIVDYLSDVFTKKSKMKVVHKSSSKRNKTYTNEQAKTLEKQKKLDDILDKISKSGYESLTKSERNFLTKASED